MNAPPALRKATHADLPFIIQLASEEPDAPRWTTGHYEEAIRDSRQATPRHIILVSDSGSEVQGFIVVSIAADEAELENVVVSKRHRRKGIGQRLCIDAFRWARLRSAKSIWLEVRDSNAAAQGFYQLLGFEAMGRRSAYYVNPPEDAVLMRCILDGATHL